MSNAILEHAQSLIRGRGVAKTYHAKEGEVESLKPLDFDIRNGEFVSVVGPSGCGKSTLLKMVGGLLPTTRGSIEIAGQRVDGPLGRADGAELPGGRDLGRRLVGDDGDVEAEAGALAPLPADERRLGDVRHRPARP